MRSSATSIDGVIVFTPAPFRDQRGMFCRTFDTDVVRDVGIDPHGFAQDSMSRSAKGVIRAFHLRTGLGEAKLVRCSTGAIFDVVVDLRRGSPTFLRWESFDLTGENQISVYIPAGCAHGFQALTDPADTAYRIDRRHDPKEDLTFAFDDPVLAVRWPLPVGVQSDKDRQAPTLISAGLISEQETMASG